MAELVQLLSPRKINQVGILTERDILKFIANEKMDLDNKVENIMSTPFDFS